MANSDADAADFAGKAGLPESARRSAARMFGTDAAHGSRRVTTTCASRRQIVKNRESKFGDLQRSGPQIWSVHRVGPLCLSLWSCATVGLAPSERHSTRVASAKKPGKYAVGTTVALKLGMFEAVGAEDLWTTYAFRVVQTWAEAVWYGKPPLPVMDALLADAEENKRESWHNIIPQQMCS